MNGPDDSKQSERPAALQNRGHGKKPYQKPSFRHERVFETRALSCGKVSVTQSGCRFNRRNS